MNEFSGKFQLTLNFQVIGLLSENHQKCLVENEVVSFFGEVFFGNDYILLYFKGETI